MEDYQINQIDKLQGSTKELVNPREKPSLLVLTATSAAGKTAAILDDSMGLASLIGTLSEATSVAFVAPNISAAILKTFLLTHALIIGSYNFETTLASSLSNNITVFDSSLDGTSKPRILFSSKGRSNMSQNPLLLNVVEPFVYTNASSLRLPFPLFATFGAVTYTLTFNIIDAVPYAALSSWLKVNKIAIK